MVGFDLGWSTHTTTVDQLVDAVEVSKRTFYANFESKEDAALAAEIELWDAYLAEVQARDTRGPLLAAPTTRSPPNFSASATNGHAGSCPPADSPRAHPHCATTACCCR